MVPSVGHGALAAMGWASRRVGLSVEVAAAAGNVAAGNKRGHRSAAKKSA